MAFEKLTNSINNLNDNIRDLAKSSADYYKLDLYKKIIKGAIFLINLMIICFICLIVVMFISIAIAISIGNALGHLSYGYFIMGGFYALIFVLFRVFGKKYIEKIVLLKSSRTFFND